MMKRAIILGLLGLFVGCGDDNNANNANNANNTNNTNNVNNTNNTNNTNNADELWPGEEVPCEENTAYEAQKSILQGGKNNPTGRGEQGSIWDPCNERVILFGGNDQQPEECNSFGDKNYLGDTWAYSLEFENWYRVDVDNAPSKRGRHTYAFDISRKKMYIFGGRFRESASMGNYRLFNDLWAFDVNTDTWKQLGTSGDIPGPRTNSGMVYDYLNDRLILFGGNNSADGLAFIPLNDTYTLDLKTMVWTLLPSAGAPPARLFHMMTMDSKRNQVLVYSGGAEDAFFGSFFTDVWRLDLDTLKWGQVWNGTTEGPAARINGQFVEDTARDRVLLFGGHDDTSLGNTNELWAFDGRGNWTVVRPGDVYTGAGCPSFCECADNFVSYDFESPERRQYPTFTHIWGTDTAVMFGGTGDCGYMDDTWHLDLASGTWTEVQAAEQGIACARTGRQDCVELCF